MPFRATEDATSGRPAVELKVLGPETFELMTTFFYQDEAKIDPARVFYEVPAGHQTDLASVPSFLWGLFASYGRQTLPALLHDRLWGVPSSDPPAVQLSKRIMANNLFLEALADEQVRYVRRHLFWGADMLDALLLHAKLRFAGIVTHLLLTTIALWALIITEAPWVGVSIGIAHSGWFLLTGLAVLIALSPVWRDLWVLIPIGAFALPVVVVEGAVTLLCAIILWLPDEVAWIAEGGPFKPDNAGPQPSLRPSKIGLR